MLATAGYESPYWITFKQAKERGAYVKKGEKGLPVIYWNWQEKVDSETGEIIKRPFLKYYTVFNAAQCTELDYPDTQTPNNPFTPIQACENIVAGMPNPPNMDNHINRAFYSVETDSVHMPPATRFDNREEYYCTLFHELTHATGHASRLGRKELAGQIVFGSHTYSKEELVGEMGAVFLCGQAGIENKVIDNSASYVASWLRKLKNDNRLVIQAAAQAQKASDYILREERSKDSSVST